MRRADACLLALGLMAIALVALVALAPPRAGRDRTGAMKIVRELGLADLCLFTEARYTRHPSMADLATAFQDHPSALEHFPSGSLVGPPAGLTAR